MKLYLTTALVALIAGPVFAGGFAEPVIVPMAPIDPAKVTLKHNGEGEHKPTKTETPVDPEDPVDPDDGVDPEDPDDGEDPGEDPDCDPEDPGDGEDPQEPGLEPDRQTDPEGWKEWKDRQG